MHSGSAKSAYDRPLSRLRIVESDARGWSDFRAYVVDVGGGSSGAVRFAQHYVCMLAGPPLATACHCDGSVARRFQTPGQFDVIPIGSEARYEDHGASTFVAASLSAALFRAAGEGLNVDTERRDVVPHFGHRDPLVEHLCWALKAELENVEPFGRVYGESLGLALATQLLREYAPRVPRRLERGLSKASLRRVVDYVADHITFDLSLCELAAIANVSPSHFAVLFRRATGLPPHQYVLRRRVDVAIDLLLREKVPLCDVALQAGFANQSHMARSLRRIAGTTPGAVRRSVR